MAAQRFGANGGPGLAPIPSLHPLDRQRNWVPFGHDTCSLDELEVMEVPGSWRGKWRGWFPTCCFLDGGFFGFAGGCCSHEFNCQKPAIPVWFSSIYFSAVGMKIRCSSIS